MFLPRTPTRYSGFAFSNKRRISTEEGKKEKLHRYIQIQTRGSRSTRGGVSLEGIVGVESSRPITDLFIFFSRMVESIPYYPFEFPRGGAFTLQQRCLWTLARDIVSKIISIVLIHPFEGDAVVLDDVRFVVPENPDSGPRLFSAGRHCIYKRIVF
jgi:hypothetical protein